MVETKLRSDKAKEAEDKAPAPPVIGVILELYFPLTKAILPTNYMTEGEAVHGAFEHFTAFPTGYAQIKDAPTNKVLLNHQQLYQRFRGK